MTAALPAELARLGWDRAFAAAFDAVAAPGLVPARVGVEHNHLYRVLTDAGELLAEAAGRLRHGAAGADALPAVGDWVAVRAGAARRATIRAVLPRRSCFARKAAGDPTRRQVVAANVDTVFLVAGLDGDFSPRRMQRYLAAAAESGAAPVVVLNKTDVCDGVRDAVDAIRALAPRVPLHATSCTAERGLDALAAYLTGGRTVALLGSSGVGKSTIVNRLLGVERQRTRSVRRGDSRGRHTTVHRELMVRPDGGIIIDTPGMRELQLWDTERALEDVFDDIEALAGDCRFRDCRHRSEPGCAVRGAVAGGRLAAGRLAHFQRLDDERAELQARRERLERLAEQRRPGAARGRGSRRLPED